MTEHRPVTDAEVEYLERWIESPNVSLGALRKRDLRRLLADRDVAMEFVEDWSQELCTLRQMKMKTIGVQNMEDADCGRCTSCKARALIAAVKGGE